MVKKTKKGDIVTRFWYTLKTLHLDANQNMPLLNDDAQMFDAPPRLYMLQWPQVKTSPCNQ